MLSFSDPDSDSSINSGKASSFEFPVSPPNVPSKSDGNNCNLKVISPPSPSINFNDLPIESFDSSDNIFSTLLAVTEPRVPRTFSPKRSHPPSDSNCSVSKVELPKRPRQKKVKSSPQRSIDKQNFTLDKDYRTTTIGNITLSWPPYGIKNATCAGENFSIYHTCPLDTGLFILYYAYKAGTDEFRNLIASDTLEAYTFLRHTFELIETNGWTVARLYWVIEKQLLKNKDSNGQYDLKDTMDTVVFQFIKSMQSFPFKSKCSCSACPRRMREYTSTHIMLT